LLPVFAPLAPIHGTAYDPVTTVVLDQVSQAGAPTQYVYQLEIDTVDATGTGNLTKTMSNQVAVTIPPLTATTLIADTFDSNRLNGTLWVPDAGKNWKIEKGIVVLGPKVKMNAPLSSFKSLSANGLEIIARVKVDDKYSNANNADQSGASIGYDSAAADGFTLKLSLHDDGSTKSFQLQFIKKQGAGKDPALPLWIPSKVTVNWDKDIFYWLKLKIDRQAGLATAWAWKDGADATITAKIDDPTAALSTFDLTAFKGLAGTPNLYGDAVAGYFGEAIIEDLTTPAATSTTSTTPASTGPIVTPYPAPTLPPPLIEPLAGEVQIPTVALKPLTIGQWGTLLSYVGPEGPLPLPCLPTPCPWRIPTVSGSCCRPDWSSSAPAMITDPASTIVVPADDTAIPDPSPAPPLNPPLVVPSPGIDMNEPTPAAARSPGTVVRAGYLPTVDEAREPNVPAPSIPPTQPPARAVVDPTWSADPGNTVPPARALRSQWTTRRDLRNFGAVATVPWPQSEAGGSPPSAAWASRSPRTDLVPHDPFSYQPRVNVIPLPPPRSANPFGQSSSSSSDQRPDVDEIIDDPSGRVWTYHFDLPARFPRSQFGFGKACCAFEGEGALIHEGMRVLARQDGQYEVRFNITTPATPILLRMQLVLHEEGNALPPRTLTLPPIPLKPWGMDPYPDATQPKFEPVSYLVRVRGYSQVVKEIQQGNGHFLLVKRIGSARFGSGFQALEN
jgi:hypothetical protein